MIKNISIGFASNLVPLILDGTKTLTYRVGDKYGFLKLGDEIDVRDSSNDKVFAKVKISEKSYTTFKDLPINREGHEVYASKEHQKKIFEKYYGEVKDEDKILVLGFNMEKFLIVVASTNPVKINTTEMGFAKMFPEIIFKIQGISAKSNVSDQPMSEQETLLGATNRAENASKLTPKADYWVGIEGGLEENANGMETFAWIVIKSKKGKIGRGRTGSFFLPKKVAALITQGKELGEADDIVFGMTNSKQSNGAVGILTGDILTRTTFYEPAVILALIPFRNFNLY